MENRWKVGYTGENLTIKKENFLIHQPQKLVSLIQVIVTQTPAMKYRFWIFLNLIEEQVKKYKIMKYDEALKYKNMKIMNDCLKNGTLKHSNTNCLRY